jgi:hypothetical protein
LKHIDAERIPSARARQRGCSANAERTLTD